MHLIMVENDVESIGQNLTTDQLVMVEDGEWAFLIAQGDEAWHWALAQLAEMEITFEETQHGDFRAAKLDSASIFRVWVSGSFHIVDEPFAKEEEPIPGWMFGWETISPDLGDDDGTLPAFLLEVGNGT